MDTFFKPNGQIKPDYAGNLRYLKIIRIDRIKKYLFKCKIILFLFTFLRSVKESSHNFTTVKKIELYNIYFHKYLSSLVLKNNPGGSTFHMFASEEGRAETASTSQEPNLASHDIRAQVCPLPHHYSTDLRFTLVCYSK